MADTTETAVTTTDTASPAPAASTPSPSTPPVAETPAASTEAAASSAPSTETVTSEPVKTETPTPPAENILGDDAPKTEAATKPDEKKDEKPADAKVETPTEAKVDLPVYEEFKLSNLPENIKIEKESLDSFNKILGEIEIGKLDHKGMQEAGQKLVDLAAKNTVDSINRLNDYYVQFHENQKKEWFDLSKKDPELGNGDENKFREIASNLRTSIDEFAGTETQRTEFRQLMKDTGVGNHPAMLRYLNNMQKKIDSYTKEDANKGIVPASRPAPSKVKDYQRFYQGAS